MKIKWKTFVIDIHPSIWAVIPIMYGIGYIEEFLTVFLAILLHELAHMAAALLYRKKVHSIKLMPIGVCAEIDENECDRPCRIFIYISGPAANVFLSLCVNLIDTYYLHNTNNMRFFVWVNMSLGLFNLLPVLPLDGGKILRELLAEHIGFFLAGRTMRWITLTLAAVLVLLGVLQTAVNHHNFSLILIGCYIMQTVKNYEMEAALMNVKDVLFRRTRLLKKGIYPARELVALKSKRLGEVLKSMDFDRFHFIYVLDEDLNLVKLLTEQQIIDGLLKYSADLTLGEYMKGEENV